MGCPNTTGINEIIQYVLALRVLYPLYNYLAKFGVGSTFGRRMFKPSQEIGHDRSFVAVLYWDL